MPRAVLVSNSSDSLPLGKANFNEEDNSEGQSGVGETLFWAERSKSVLRRRHLCRQLTEVEEGGIPARGNSQ